MSRRARHRAIMHVAMAAPMVAITFVVVACFAYPGFNHATQYLSELGTERSAAPLIFNIGVVVSGVLAGVSGLGFGLAAAKLGGSRIAAALVILCFLAAAAGLIMAGLYHWPDPRHRFINLGLGIVLAPVLLLWALGGVSRVARLRIFLVGTLAAMATLTVLTHHMILPHLVNDANVGWWERVFALVLVGWTGVAAFALERRMDAESETSDSSVTR